MSYLWYNRTLPGNKRSSFPHRCIYFDTETLPEGHRKYTYLHFRLGTAIYRRYSDTLTIEKEERLTFTAIKEFHAFLLQHVTKRDILYVFAHNIDFDATTTQLYDALTDAGFHIGFFVAEPSAFIFEFISKQGRIKLVDTMNYYKTSLKQIGKIVDLPKMDMPDFSDTNKKWIPYCMRDTEICAAAVERIMHFIKDNALGTFTLTIPSQAMRAYRHRFMQTKIKIAKNSQVVKQEIAAYHGGRCEAFHIGKIEEKPIYVLDVNSMYPYVMKEYEYPIEFLGFCNARDPEELLSLSHKYAVIADLHFHTTKPALPYVHDKLLFPVGSWRGTYTTPEVQWLCNNAAIDRIYSILLYRKAAIFDKYVEFFITVKNQAKKEKNLVEYQIAKLFLNSLYGKFGQRIGKYEKIAEDPIIKWGKEEVFVPATFEQKTRYILNHVVYEQQERKVSRNSNIAIAAHITAYARMWLWQLIEKAVRENVYYCDTDSLFVNKKGLVNVSKLLSNNKLGMLKVEDICNSLEIIGAKMYIKNGHRKFKGVPYKAIPISDRRFVYNEFVQFKTKLRRGDLNTQYIVKKVKYLKDRYDKGVVRPDGHVDPLVVVE